MTDLPKLQLKPLRAGYGFELSTGVVSTDTQVGLPRQRLASVGVVHRVSPTYKCTRAQWQYFLAFMRAYRGRAFYAYLLLDDIDHHWYECRMVNESLKVSTLGDQIFSVQLDLIVKPRAVPIDQDLGFLAMYEMSQAEQDDYFNHLEKLVNRDLPNATRGGLNGN